MAKILVGYELGAGHGHVHRLMPVVHALEAEGHEVIFFLRNIKENAVLLARERRPILPVPDLVQRIPGVANPAPMGTYLDIMCHSGFYRRQTLHAGMLAWCGLIDQVDPDLVICDHSPVCLLACFQQRPAVQVADGFTLPPAEGDVFPFFRKGRKHLVDPAHVLRVMQYVQQQNGRPVPQSVTEPFRTAGRLICTLPELDPYTTLRQDPVIGPVEGLQQPQALPGKPHFFAYVSLEHKKTKAFLRGLRASSMSGEVFARGMTDEVAKALTRPGLTVHREPQPMTDIIARATMIIHHGGNGTCCAALSGGRVQLTLPTHMEARLSSDALSNLGVGRLLNNKDLDAALPAILEEVAENSAMAERATALAGKIKARGPHRPVKQIVETCLKILS
ncbi:glycosyltransferase family 1 protein [Pelagibius litoralis]|uniref:Glycosyltransferase family 1 protein n=1 Tax=Pelagibius litoralis TaxID=374515 RepID=A0A967KEP6_9PROT|nr:glycosyltransferase family 1 protein [Pelagibius litoralis]NIA72029.1 glycosyltransferase family 1 protein [Pelagibius litoralis]